MKCARGAASASLPTVDPPSDAEFPAEIAEKFDDGQPWYNAADELSCFKLWRALDEDM